MIKLRNLILEDPDQIKRYAPDLDRKELVVIYFDDPRAYAFYTLPDGTVVVDDSGGIHRSLILLNPYKYFKLVANRKPAWDTYQKYIKDYPEEDIGYENVVKAILNSPERDWSDPKERYEDEFYSTLINEIQELVTELMEMRGLPFGRFWKKYKVGDIRNANVISFWQYPMNKEDLMKLLKKLKLDPDQTFVETKNSVYLIPASEYERPSQYYTPPVKHELPPHLR